MMREIKFRTWDNVTKTYHYWGFCGRWGFFCRPDADATPGRYTHEQYTGLKDKNGKEIYEGDILKVNGEDEFGCTTVFWDEEKKGFNASTWSPEWDGDQSAYGIKIAGNIHENPELLK